jgi:leucyl aminopeptidase
MLEISLAIQDALVAQADLLAVGVDADLEPGPAAAAAAEALGCDLPALLRGRGFRGKVAEAVVVPTLGRLPAAALLVVGLGERAKLDLEALRRTGAAIVRNAGGASSAVTTLPQVAPEPLAAARAVAEGAVLASYRFDRYKGDHQDGSPGRLDSLEIAPGEDVDRRAAERAVVAGAVRARATNLARDLANEPANNLRPADLAREAERLLAASGVRVQVLDEQALRDGGFGGILGVGQGSDAPPRLVELVYEPDEARGRVVLVGKGITFDSGGLSIKSTEGMIPMKTDMAGAAAVLAVMGVLAELDIRLAVTGYLAAAENMPSGTAVRPGDVLRMKNGKTVEVINTDAEGRLVLADALTIAAGGEPDAIVDVATLTGSCVVALGQKYAGLMGNDPGLNAEFLRSAREAGEPTWELPLPVEYEKDLVSEVADLRNVGTRWGGALVAGLFLREFVDGRPWVHLDIAGPSRSEADDGYTPKGATGASVRTLLSWLEGRSAREA